MSYASVVGRDREEGERGGERDQDDRDSNGRRDRGPRDRDRGRGRTDKDRLGISSGSGGGGRLSIVEEEAARFQGHNKTLEELQLENSTLRKTIEHMAKDMQVWRKKTEEGLKSSILEIISKDGTAGTSLSRPGSRRGSPNRTNRRLTMLEDDDEDYSEGRRMGDEEAWRDMVKELKDLEAKMRDLEDELGGRKQEVELLRVENDRLNKALRKWEDRWDRLQKRAKEKESRKEGR
jgi:regulator of replication initiation timing